MSIIDSAKEWLLSVALKKVAKRVAYLLAAWIAAQGGVLAGAGANITIDPEKLTLALYGLWEGLRNWLKIKWPGKFGFL